MKVTLLSNAKFVLPFVKYSLRNPLNSLSTQQNLPKKRPQDQQLLNRKFIDFKDQCQAKEDGCLLSELHSAND